MKTVIEMAREAGFFENNGDGQRLWLASNQNLERFAELVRADEQKKWQDQTAVEIHEAVLDEREQIAQMIQDAPPLVEFAQNEHGGCLMCGFTPRLAAASIRARSQA